MAEDWNVSLFGCFDDCSSCLCGTFCTSCLFGRNAKKIDDSNACAWCCLYCGLSPFCLCCIPHLMKRITLRLKYDLPVDPNNAHELVVVLCCSPCALCQETRFIKQKETGPQTRQPRANL